MNLAALLTEVYSLTNRPDLVTQSTTAVKAATLKLHGMDYFYKDLVDTSILFAAAAKLQSFDYKLTFPLWRNIKYLRKYDATLNEGTDFLDIIPPDFVVDGYSINRENVCYMAGSLLNIRSSSDEIRYLIGYYRNPDITTDGWDSWIADELPYAIVFEAAKTVFKIIGKDDEEMRMRDMMDNPDYGYIKQVKVLGLADLGGV